MYNNVNFDAFRFALQKTEWDLCFDNSVNIDDICDKWCNTFMKIAYENIPNRNITVPLGDKPWYNKDLCQFKRAKIVFITRLNSLIILTFGRNSETQE